VYGLSELWTRSLTYFYRAYRCRRIAQKAQKNFFS